MLWPLQQEQALRRVSQWLSDPDQQVFCLFGYAGTGKTTLAKHLATGVDGDVCFCAYTGKAAHVLRQKGCEDATTIHSLIYKTHDRDPEKIEKMKREIAALAQLVSTTVVVDQQTKVERAHRVQLLAELRYKLSRAEKESKSPMFRLNQESRVKTASLIVVDEASMVGERIGRDLESFGKKILVLGDPAQLPPVGDAGYFTKRKPDFLLTEIHRQAQDSPILRIATMARERKNIPYGSWEGCSVIANDGQLAARGAQADQLLVGKNDTRRESNLQYRKRMVREGTLLLDHDHPQPGDKLVCLRNDHELGLLNGSLWEIEGEVSINEDAEQVHMVVKSAEGMSVEPIAVVAHLQHFEGKEDSIPYWAKKSAQEFTYGYALTVHKAQGSQWDDVVLYDQSRVFREDWWRWLYTGITRAAKRLTVVR